jgi:hypothetical protein
LALFVPGKVRILACRAPFASVYLPALDRARIFGRATQEPAIKFHESVMGFTSIHRDATTAVLRRDEALIGLAVKPDHQPNEAGSLAFALDDLDIRHCELSDRGGKPGEFGIDEWGGKQFRTFFLR